MLYHLVSAYHGNKQVMSQEPHLIFNCDDETSYICEGIQLKQGSKYGLVPTSSLEHQRTDSIYHQEDSNRMNGRCVKNHFMTNALGDSALAIITTTGMSERELPKDNFIALKFEGLCVSGYGVGGLKKPGLVLMMRGYSGTEIDPAASGPCQSLIFI